MNQRSPSVRPDPKTPHVSKNHHHPRLPVNLRMEGVSKNSLEPSYVSPSNKHETTSLAMHLHEQKSAYLDGLSKIDPCKLHAQAAATVPAKFESSSTNTGDQIAQKRPRLRIKVRDHSAQKDAAVYSGLGLIAPSSTSGHSSLHRGREHSESHKVPVESPPSKLQEQYMTSFPVSEAMRLSPLHPKLLNLTNKRSIYSDTKSYIPMKVHRNDSAVLVDESTCKVSKDRKRKSDGRIGTVEDTSHGVGVNNLNNMISPEQKHNRNENLDEKQYIPRDMKFKILPSPMRNTSDFAQCVRTNQAGMKTRKEVPLKKRDFVRDWVKDKSVFTSVVNKESVKLMNGRDHGRYDEKESKSGLMERIRGHRIKNSENHLSVDLRGHSRLDVSKRKKDIYSKVKNYDVLEHKRRTKMNVAKLPVDNEDLHDIGLGHNTIRMDRMERSFHDSMANDRNIEAGIEKDATNKIANSQGHAFQSVDNWVQCDSCEKWRLLPYGTDAEQLPDNWLCSMINWLPGMNSCAFSEEDTTNALRAVYQSLIDKFATGVVSADVPSFDQNLGRDTMLNQGKKKHKAKELPMVVSSSGVLQTPNLTKNAQQENLKNRFLNGMDKTVLKENLICESSTQYPDNLSDYSSQRHACQQKQKHIDEGATKTKRLQLIRECDQSGYNTSKRVTTKADVSSDEYRDPQSCGNLGRIGLNSNYGFQTSTKWKTSQKHKEHLYAKVGNYEMKDQLQITEPQRNSTPGIIYSSSVGMTKCNERHGMKRKVMERPDSQSNLKTLHNAESNLPDNEYREKVKSKNFMTNVQNSSGCRGDCKLHSKGKANRIILSSSRDGLSVRNDQRRQLQLRKSYKSRLTWDDIVSLKKDLGYDRSSSPVASSSSKVPGTHKRSSYEKGRGSPVESVSSAPLRPSSLDKVSLARRGSLRNDYANTCERSAGDTMKSLKDDIKLNRNQMAVVNQAHDVRGEADSSVKPQYDFRGKHLLTYNEDTRTQCHQCVKVVHSDYCQSAERGNTRYAGTSGMFQLTPGQVPSLEIQDHPHHACKLEMPTCVYQPVSLPMNCSGPDIRSSVGFRDVSKVEQQQHIVHQNGAHQGTENLVADHSVCRDIDIQKNVKGRISGQTATNVLREAEHLKGHADHLKNSGFKFDSIMAYFQAALNFLSGASLLENSTSSSGKSIYGKMPQLQTYSNCARLFETCAQDFEEHDRMSAALAYKCTEVAYMRACYCKSSIAKADWFELQADLQMVPQGESPPSPASDADNSHIQVTVDDPPLLRGTTSNTANHDTVVRNPSAFNRTLQFAHDMSYAIEASRKAVTAFEAAKQETTNGGADVVERVVHSSYHEIDEFIGLVSLANEAICSSNA